MDKEFFGTFYEKEGYLFDRIPDQEFLVDLLIIDDETDISEAVEKAKEALEKENEETLKKFQLQKGKDEAEKKEKEEQRKREENEKEENELFVRKNIECELSSFSNRFGSPFLKRRIKEGYEWIELAEEEFCNYVIDHIGDHPTNTENWYSDEHGGRNDGEPNEDQFTILDHVNEQLKKVYEDTGFKYIDIEAHTSVWDAGDDKDTTEVKGVEIGLLGRKLFFAA